LLRSEERTMRTTNIFPDFKDEGEVIASWGGAKLVKHWDGRLELRGGSREEVGEAREWLSLFWHEAVVSREI
jgi:hypothetical protein